MKFKSTLAFAFALLSAAANAEPIQFKFTGVADFTVAGTSYPSNSFVVTLLADTTDRQSITIIGRPTYFYYGLVGGLEIASLGTGTFTSTMGVFTNQNGQVAGFTPDISSDLLGVFNPALASYDMQSPLASVTGAVFVPRAWFDESTSFGSTSAQNVSSLYFSASLVPVPEPTQGVLFTIGMLALAAICRRTKRATTVSRPQNAAQVAGEA